MLSPGDRVKDFEVIAPLRSGGMAMLYLARRRGVGGFSRLVALKLVHPDLLEDETIHRLFLNEARISAAVAHPNVVNVEEIGRTGDSYFIAMEYVHGVSLAELLNSLSERRLRMSQKLCVWLVAQIAEALHAVHEATGENGLPLHIVHRDVSPQNVLIGHTGHVKLIDFGIAKRQPRGQQSSGLAVLGKLGYMAPEQLRGETADRRTDVYALGVMLWEMLTSRSLFRCHGLDDERDWTRRENPIPPSTYAPISSPALDEAVVKALAFKPEDRHQTAFDFRAALLRADPEALLVDAPTFAALMRSMLGDELARKKAHLPSEVSMQLDLDAESVTSRAFVIDELTADVGNLESKDGEDDDAPTCIDETPAGMRSQRRQIPPPPPTIVVDPRLPRDTEPGPPPTVVLSPLEAKLADSASASRLRATTPFPARHERTARVTWVGAVCLGLGMILGAAVSGSHSVSPTVADRIGSSKASAMQLDVADTALTSRLDAGNYAGMPQRSEDPQAALARMERARAEEELAEERAIEAERRRAARSEARRATRERDRPKRISSGSRSSKSTKKSSASTHRSRHR